MPKYPLKENSEETNTQPPSVFPPNQTSPSEIDTNTWNEIANDPEFRALLSAKAKFVIPATIFFIVYYFALPILVGWFPKMMSHEALGSINWAYLFALSQFVMAWGIALLYLFVAKRWDKRVSSILRRFGK